MFDIAWSEILLTAVVALIFIGPKELPAVLFKLGKMLSKLRILAETYRRQFETSMREAGFDDLHRNIQDIKALNPANQIKDTLSRAMGPDPLTTLPPVYPKTATGAAYTAHELDQRLKEEQNAAQAAANAPAPINNPPAEGSATDGARNEEGGQPALASEAALPASIAQHSHTPSLG